MNPLKLTIPQQDRQELYFELCKAVGDDYRLHQSHLRGDFFWIHFTDAALGGFDMEKLRDEKLLVLDPTLVYQPDGSWRDDYPPRCYRLSEKGAAILNNPHDWVFYGRAEYHD